MSIASAQITRQQACLDKLVRYQDKKGKLRIGTRRVFVEYMVLECSHVPIMWQEDRIKDMSAMAYFRASEKEQHAHQRKQEAAGKKKCYGLQGPSRRVIVINKTEHDYALQVFSAHELAQERKRMGCIQDV